MNVQIAEDFRDALLALQDVAADLTTDSEADRRTAQLVEQAFAFLDSRDASEDYGFELPEQLAA